MPKNTSRISTQRLTRFFVGTHDEKNPKSERWQEMGHFIEGVDFKLRKVRQQDGLLRQRTKMLGQVAEGSAEPAQNAVEDYKDYMQVMNGLRNIAFLCGDQLWLFRLRYLGGGSWQDNRIQLVSEAGYSDTMQKAFLEFSGWVQEVEIVRVKDLKLTGTQLTYKALASTLFSDAIESNVTIGS